MDLRRFCGVCADDRRFFGLVTGAAPGSAAEREAEAGSSSCHVFMAEPITSQVRAESHHCGDGNTDLILNTMFSV